MHHGWANHQRRGGNVYRKKLHGRNRLWDVDDACQRSFGYRKWQRLFAVHVVALTTHPSPPFASRDT